ncbi:MAG: polysaccharide biosynthesis protein [Candidatus Aenigmarchaeota archaeon]|nr:polysaccharide biosynthesis protein [Candidatus Aenigmarchaeota archaeon]
MLTGKTILILGAGGSLGRVTIREILKHNPKLIIAYDNHELNLFNLEQEFGTEKVRYMLADITDSESLDYATSLANYVFVFSAVKHVRISNYSPEQCIKVNVVGTLNAFKSAMKSPSVERFVYMSSDKACHPTSLYGTTKLIPEYLIALGNNIVRHDGKIAYTIRFGNFFGSKGSVVPKWLDQKKHGKAITVTHPEMRRLMMPMDEVAKFVFDSLTYAKDGDIIVPKMKVVKIKDLADVISDKQIITKPDIGEKLDEVLVDEQESVHTKEEDGRFVIRLDHKNGKIPFEYTSANAQSYTKEEVKKMVDEFIKEYR